MSEYDRNTLDAPNPLARFAHRNRFARSAKIAREFAGAGRVLDYGSGTGHFVDWMNAERSGSAIGFEPFMATDNPDICRDFADVTSRGPFALVTLFEVIEHLSELEVGEFSDRCRAILDEGGQMLISAPIEIGPSLIAKEFNRAYLRGKKSDYSFGELARAAVLGIPGRRAGDIKGSHKGFDFRRAIEALERLGWAVRILSYGPLPLLTWYGNSQAYMLARRRSGNEQR